MKQILSSLFKQLIFWLLFFAFTRAVFLIYHYKLIIIENAGFFEIISSFYNALLLDLATTCYILFFPFFLLLIQSVYHPKWLNIINKIYTAILLLLYSIISATELGIYEEWKTKLHYKALMYLKHPDEIFNTASTGNFFLLIFILLCQFAIGYYIYQKYFYRNIINIKRNYIFSFLFLIITPVLLIIGMRGGLQEIPINQSQSYYSKHNILNLAATNSVFNLYISVFENYKNFGKNPFLFYKPEDALKVVESIYKTQKDSTIYILKNKNPNIVLLILESWSADLISSLGGIEGITPQFHELEKKGILFTNIYASGTRSEQGMACIYAGFPAHPISAITVQPDKYVKLPSLNRILRNKGYSTSFYFGGQLIYGNIKSYIIYNKFDKITEIYDFSDSLPQGKLGVHDEYVLDYQLKEMNKEKQAFFSTVFTLSTHSPFDMPMEKTINFWDNNNNMNMYLNSAYYTDKCLGEYFEKARQQDWFDNTLFIIVADHSHYSYRYWSYHSPEYHKIPLLFYGNVIKDEYRGIKCEKLGSQTDIAGTLLPQIGIDASEFQWSKNLLNIYSPEFAYVAFEEGIGWKRPAGYFFYDNRFNHYYNIEIDTAMQDSIIKEGKSFLQTVFQEYMDY
ncbi:MAG: sulfatase-like hydrolase/transferase [Bacteroidales bacterium]|nr:sulfatase-like hydrolase/transferase [Bacteroidales bacterium]